jgi:hypothetical protein
VVWRRRKVRLLDRLAGADKALVLNVQDLAAGVGSFWSLDTTRRTGVCVHDVHGSESLKLGSLEDLGVEKGMGRSKVAEVSVSMRSVSDFHGTTGWRYLKSTDQTDWSCSAA